MGWFILGFIIAMGLCATSDRKATERGRIMLGGRWYKIIRIEEVNKDDRD